MRSYLTLAAAVIAFAPSSVFAGEADCLGSAAQLVKDGGKEILQLVTDLREGNPVSVVSLKDNKELIGAAESYVASGCAQSHLEKALGRGTMVPKGMELIGKGLR